VLYTNHQFEVYIDLSLSLTSHPPTHPSIQAGRRQKCDCFMVAETPPDQVPSFGLCVRIGLHETPPGIRASSFNYYIAGPCAGQLTVVS
jgi:hypothetical protein